MTISSSQLAPDEVARHTFATTRRGFDPDEVRTYLDAIAQALRSQSDRESELRRSLEEAEHRAANPVLDEETLAASLGQETSRVLRTAHEAASEMVAKATTESERLLAEAHEEIAATEARVSEQLAEQVAQHESDLASSRRRAEEEADGTLEQARTQAGAIIEQARAQGQAMIEEAQALRARVLADLSRRRKVLHAQIEQLRAGREHLAATVREVRDSIDVIADDLFRAEDQARLAAEEAGRAVAARPDAGTPEDEAAALLAEEADQEIPEADALVDPSVGEDSVEVVAVVEVEEVLEVVDVIEVPTGEELATEVESDATPEAGDSQKPSVDDLFAKIRASTAESERDEPEAPIEGDEPEGSSEPTEFPPGATDVRSIRRDELVEPITKALARRLKRTFQDDQNDVLHRLRSNHSTWSIDVLPVEPEHHDVYSTAALPFLEEAAQAGASFAGSEGTSGPSVDELLGVAHELAETVVGPLRRRLADDGRLQGAEETEVAEHVGAAFREWKGARVERLAGDFVIAAFSAGIVTGAGVDPAARLEWVAVASPDAEPCPDCEDNALNGPQRPGEAYPTGHLRPPAHPGCRCLLAPSAT